MKAIFISDTHGLHDNLELPSADVIFHTGDISKKGSKTEIVDFLNWFKQLNYRYKIFIAGNHDLYFEKADEKEIKNLIPSNIIYLNDSGIEIEGIKIWGSPVQPWFFDWAFNRKRGDDIAKHWRLIPHNTDLLLTHGPPYGILDKTFKQTHVGCEDLMKHIQLIQPKIHAFGHIHEAYGMQTKNKTTYINSSVVNLNYQLSNKPILFNIKNL